MFKQSLSVLLLMILTAMPVVIPAMGSNGGGKAAGSLAALLPASDAIVTFEADRFFSQALPQILSGNEKLFVEMMSKVDEIRQMTGVDLRQFDEVAVGVSSSGALAEKADYQPLILARGKFSSDSLVAIVKIAGSGRYREEQIGVRTVYIFSPSEMMAKNKPKGTSMMDNVIGSIIENLDREMALTAYDGGTLAIGTTARVKELLDGKSKADAEILSAVGKKQSSLMGLAMRTPAGFEQFLRLDNDTLGNSLKGVRMISGGLDVANSSASLSLSAKTATVEQATGIKQTLDGFKAFLPAMLGGGKGKNQIYGRLVENARITRVGLNVSLDLTIPQSDIDVLVGK